MPFLERLTNKVLRASFGQIRHNYSKNFNLKINFVFRIRWNDSNIRWYCKGRFVTWFSCYYDERNGPG